METITNNSFIAIGKALVSAALSASGAQKFRDERERERIKNLLSASANLHINIMNVFQWISMHPYLYRLQLLIFFDNIGK